jgi:hypothetical protein
MLTAFQKAAKYAGLDDDKIVPAVLDHPNIEGAMTKLNEEMQDRLLALPVQRPAEQLEEAERWDGMA